MSLTNTNTKVKYAGDGGTTSFAITFDIILNSSEVKVILRDETDPENITETLQVEGVDYNLTGASPPSIPFPTTVEMVTAPSATQELLVYRDMPLTQLLDYLETSEFRAESQESSLDKLTAILQELAEEISRAPKLTISTDGSTPIEMQDPKANNLLSWNETGDAIINVTNESAIETPVVTTDQSVVRWDGVDGDSLDNSGVLIDDSNNVTVPGTLDVTGAVTVTSATATLAGSQVLTTDNNQTVTNKTIDADLNTVSNLAHGAEVDNPTSGVHGVTGSVVGTSDAQTLTNKTFDDEVTLQEIVTPATPAAGYLKIYPKADGQVYKLDDAGAESPLGGGDLWSDPVDADIIPDATNTHDLGQALGPQFDRIHAQQFRATQQFNLRTSGTASQSEYSIGTRASSYSGNLQPYLRSNLTTSNIFGILTDNRTSATASQSIAIETGNNTSTGNSGGIRMIIGSVVSGSRGEFRFLKNGLAPSIGDVWTCSSVDGDGYWSAPASGVSGGAGGLKWQELGDSPIQSQEFFSENYLYQNGITQNLFTQIEVPPGYTAGDPIAMRINWYSPDTSGTGLIRAQATLIRPGTDAFSSTVNQRTTTNAAISLTVANDLNTVSLDLTDGSGQINAVGVSVGDIIKIRLYRDTDTGTSDIRFLPSIVGVSYE